MLSGERIMVIRCLLVIMISFFSVHDSLGKQETSASFRIMTEIMDPFQVMERGKLKGSNVDFVRKVFSSAKIDLPRIDVYPWPRAFESAQQPGNRFIFPMVRTPEREDRFNWVGKIAESEFFLYGLKSDQSIGIGKLADAKQFKIALMKNDVAYNYFKRNGFNDGEHLLVMSERETIEKLFFNGRLPVIISSPFLINQQARLHGKNPQDYEKKYFLADLTVEFYLASSLTTDRNLIKLLQQNWPDEVLKH